MDRPLGPRQPDRRQAAYQDIFGRSGPAQPRPGYAASTYGGGGYPGPSQQPVYPYAGQPYIDPRQAADGHAAYAQSVYGVPYAQPQPAPISYQHPTYYAQSAAPQTYYPNYAQSTYAQTPYSQPQMLSPPQQAQNHSRTKSIASSQHVNSAISPRPEEPPDPQLEAYIRAGMTPAQAYQQVVYMQGQAPQHRSSTYASSTYTSDIPPPRIGLTLETDDGRLGIDFGDDSQSSSSGGATTDEGVNSRHSAPLSQDRHSSPTLSRRKSRLQVDTQLPASPASSASHGTSSTASHATSSTSSTAVSSTEASSVSRRSTESTRTMPGSYRRGSYADRSRSMSAAMTPSIRSVFDASTAVSKQSTSPGSIRGKPRLSASKLPSVYPALLSRVALALKERVVPGDRVKDGLTYKGAFDGRDAVDKIAAIIKTSDRNLALLLGRALDAQKFFHDVTYDHRLRDAPAELYQFRTTVKSYEVNDEDVEGRPTMRSIGSSATSAASTPPIDRSVDSHEDIHSPTTPIAGDGKVDDELEEADVLPSGVFTLLTDCYSPTCSRDRLCYSIACPRRLEQQARLNMKPVPGLKKQDSRESIGEEVEPGALWIHSVPKEIADAMSDSDKRRQEAINEVIYTEHDFVRDMEYLRDVWVNPLKTSDVIPEARRTDFLEQVFWNVHDIIAVNTRLRDALKKRQKHHLVVERIGDVLADAVPHFGPFVSYGAHQLYGKFEFEKEKAANPAFAAFVETAERLPESRKLELNGYLTKPTTRLARYPLLLEAVLKHTPDDHPDKQVLPQVIALVRDFLGKVNAESGKTENRFNLLQLDQQLIFRPGEQVDLRLREEGRELVYKGILKKRGNSQSDSGDIQVFLFDHALLFVKQKTKNEQYKVYRRPIPLELLVISHSDDQGTTRRDPRSRYSATPSRSSFSRNSPYPPVIPAKTDGKGGFSITFAHLGKKFYQITLWAPTSVTQKKWIEHITRQQDLMRERSTVFDTEVLSEGFFVGLNKVNCAAPFNGGRRMVYGTDDGVYMSDVNGRTKEPIKMLALSDVTQIDVLEEYQLLLVLSERQVLTLPMDALDQHDPMAGLKRAKRISNHTTFFKAGYCLGKAVVCAVKSSPLSSTFRVFEPIAKNTRERTKLTLKQRLQGGNDTLSMFREFYIPVESSSIHYMKTRLIIGCTKGFEIVDLDTLDTQGLLNPADDSLSFVTARDTPLKPMAIYRIDSDFLLCFDEFAFYINREGYRARTQFMVYWEGQPTGFALQYPYVLAFEPTFVEIRHVETGAMAQIIQGSNLRLLFADMPPSTTHSAASASAASAASSSFAAPSQAPYNPYAPPVPNQFGAYNPYAGYAQPQAPYPGWPQQQQGSAYGRNGYAASQYGYQPQASSSVPTPPPPPAKTGFGRDEIVLVSDDRVMTIHLGSSAELAGDDVQTNGGLQAPLPPLPASDAVSVYSMTR